MGVQFTMTGATFTNSGTVAGGNGGAAGAASGEGIAGTPGAGGVGIVGAGLTIIDSNTISGGLGGDGVTRADAIDFTGGTNTLTLEAGYSIVGNVVAYSTADTLALGGTGTATFDVSLIGASAQYEGFGVFEKTGTSTWSLTGTTTAATAWTIYGGTLALPRWVRRERVRSPSQQAPRHSQSKTLRCRATTSQTASSTSVPAS